MMGRMDTKNRWSRIWYVGNLAGNYVRFAPNPGFRLGPWKWSLVYGRRR